MTSMDKRTLIFSLSKRLLDSPHKHIGLLRELLGVRPNVFLPSIPNLPYQYATFSSFDAPPLALRNPEAREP